MFKVSNHAGYGNMKHASKIRKNCDKHDKHALKLKVSNQGTNEHG
jgi:hypothetical protein